MEEKMVMINVNKLVGGNITITTSRAATRLWWTSSRSGEMRSRDGGDYSDVNIVGVLN